MKFEEIQAKAQLLKNEQERLTPYLTLRRMAEILNYSSPAPVQNLLNRMLELGLAEEVDWGNQKRYRIL